MLGDHRVDAVALLIDQGLVVAADNLLLGGLAAGLVVANAAAGHVHAQTGVFRRLPPGRVARAWSRFGAAAVINIDKAAEKIYAKITDKASRSKMIIFFFMMDLFFMVCVQ